MVSDKWWVPQGPVDLTAFRGKLDGPLALWQAPLFTAETADATPPGFWRDIWRRICAALLFFLGKLPFFKQASGAASLPGSGQQAQSWLQPEERSVTVADYAQYCKPVGNYLPAVYNEGNAWKAEALAEGMGQKFTATASKARLYFLQGAQHYTLRGQTSPALMRRLKEAADRKAGDNSRLAAYIVTDIIKAEHCIVCEATAMGAHVTADLSAAVPPAAAAASLAGVSPASITLGADRSHVITSEYANDAVIAFAMKAMTWPADPDGLPSIDQAGYHTPSWRQRGNGISSWFSWRQHQQGMSSWFNNHPNA